MKQNFHIFKQDRKNYERMVKPYLTEEIPINIFCSFTYLTPNYAVLFTLNELKRITDDGNFRIFLILWDMGTLANPYFKKLVANRKIESPDKYLKEKISELKNIALSLGINKEKIFIYKSSDLWVRLISYKEENLFQDFYSLLSKMKIKDFIENKKVSNIIQIPLDIFFCNFFHKLFPEDIDKPMDLAFLGYNKLKIYDNVRSLMHKEGLLQMKKPLFLLMNNFPYLNYESYVPEWGMSLKEIRNIIDNCPITKKEIFSLFNNIYPLTKIAVKEGSKINLLDYSGFETLYKNKSIEILKKILSENLFYYLKKYNQLFKKYSGQIDETIININKKSKLKEVGQILKSNISLNILLLSNGTKTITEISKILEKSVATISIYANKLKKIEFIRVLPNNKLKRNLKGLKINFDLGIS